MKRTRIKICGITTEADAWAAIDAGADALGFNLWPQSKRYLELEAAAPWIGQLPAFVGRIAVTVNEPIERLRELAVSPLFEVLQLHGEETPEVCATLRAEGRRFIKAIGVKDEHSLSRPDAWGTGDLLLDAFAPGEFGGTGRRMNWPLAASFAAAHPALRCILSGGLTPSNVAGAVRMVRPYAVDVASGVEESPGRKSARLMRDFIAAVRFAN